MGEMGACSMKCGGGMKPYKRACQGDKCQVKQEYKKMPCNTQKCTQNYFFIKPRAESHRSKVLTMVNDPLHPPGSAYYITVLGERLEDTCNESQMWKIELADIKTKSVLIQNVHNNWVLDVEGGSMAEGTPIILWYKKETPGYQVNQLWTSKKDGIIETQLKEGMVMTFLLEEFDPYEKYNYISGGGMMNRLVIMNVSETLSDQQLWDLVPVKKMYT